MIRVKLLVGVLFAVLLAGCQKPSVWDRIPLSGTANLDGSPFTGAIAFRPSEGNRGPSAMTRVDNGKFEFAKKAGPVAGQHTATLIPKPNQDREGLNRVSIKTNVPAAAPYTLALEFDKPEIMPEAESWNRQQAEERLIRQIMRDRNVDEDRAREIMRTPVRPARPPGWYSAD